MAQASQSECVCVCVCMRMCVAVSQRYTLLIWQPTAQPITCFLSLPISMWGCCSQTSSWCGGRHGDGEDRMDTHVNVCTPTHMLKHTHMKHWTLQRIYWLSLISWHFGKFWVVFRMLQPVDASGVNMKFNCKTNQLLKVLSLIFLPQVHTCAATRSGGSV